MDSFFEHRLFRQAAIKSRWLSWDKWGCNLQCTSVTSRLWSWAEDTWPSFDGSWAETRVSAVPSQAGTRVSGWDHRGQVSGSPLCYRPTCLVEEIIKIWRRIASTIVGLSIPEWMIIHPSRTCSASLTQHLYGHNDSSSCDGSICLS